MGASDAEIENAARVANAHSFVSALPDGYATDVGSSEHSETVRAHATFFASGKGSA